MKRIQQVIMKSGVYQIISTLSGKIYIGSAVRLEKRKNEHFNNLRKGIHENPRLQNHFNKYGESDLSFVVIEYCIRDICLAREQAYLDSCNPFFNISKCASAPMKGKHHTEDTLKKIRETSKQLWLNPEYRRTHEEYTHSKETLKKMHDAHFGEKQSEEEIANKRIRVKKLWQDEEYRKSHVTGMRGKKQSEEHRRKNSESRKKYFARPEIKQKRSNARKLWFANLTIEQKQIYGDKIRKGHELKKQKVV